jgi:two-component system LytT family response regulator
MQLAKLTNSKSSGIFIEEIDHLKQEIAKLKLQLRSMPGSVEKNDLYIPENKTNEFIILHSNKIIYRIPVGHICKIEALDNYSMIHLENGTRHLTTKTLQYWDNELSNYPNMIRAHRSHTINLHYLSIVDTENKEIVLLNGSRIKFSRSKKKDIISWVTEGAKMSNLITISN